MSRTLRTAAAAALAAGLAALALLVYYPATGNDFVWDDPIVFDQQLHAFHSARDVLVPPPRIPQFGTHYYRPTIVATYLLDQTLFGREASGYHLSVLFWHALATALVFLLGLELGRSRDGSPGRLWPAALGSALFAVHPIHTESVVWMTGRSDTVAAPLVLAALLLHLRGRRGAADPKGWPLAAALSWGLVVAAWATLAFLPGPEASATPGLLLGAVVILGGVALVVAEAIGRASPLVLFGPSAVLLLLAAGAKETALGVLLLYPLLPFLLPPETGIAAAPEGRSSRAERRARRGGRGEAAPAAGSPATGRLRPGLLAAQLCAVLAVALYFFYRSKALGSGRSGGGSSIGALMAGADDFLRSVAWYARKTVWPEPLSAFIGGVPGGRTAVLAGLLLLAGALALLILFRRAGWRREAVALALFFVFLAPPLTIVFNRVSETVLAERYLYLPSAGACLLVAFLLARLGDRLPAAGVNRRAAAALVIVPALLLGLVWSVSVRQRIPIWADDLSFWSDAARKAPDHGLPHLHHGMALASESGRLAGEAAALRRGGSGDEAGPGEEALARADELDTRSERLEAEAEAEYHLAWATYDDNEGRQYTANNLGNLYSGRAGRLTVRARRAEGEERQRLMRLARAASDDAREQFARAMVVNPRYHKAPYNWAQVETRLGALARMDGDVVDYARHLDAVIPLFEQALQRNNRYFLAYRGMGGALFERGVYEEAAARYEQAARWARTAQEKEEAAARLQRARERLAAEPPAPADRARRLREEGDRHLAAGRSFSAMIRYWAALRVNPQEARAASGWGQLLQRELDRLASAGRPGRVVEALQRSDGLTRRALEAAPGDPVVRLVRARFLLRAALHREARETLRPVLGAGGDAGRTARRIDEAARMAAAELPGEPGPLGRALLQRAERARGRGDLGGAALLLWAAVRAAGDPVDPAASLGALLREAAEARKEAGASHEAREAFETAAESFRLAVEARPDSFEAREGLGICYLEAGLPVRAAEHLERALALAPGPDAAERLTARLEEAREGSRIRLPR